MPGVTLENLPITQTFYGWFTKTNEIIDNLNNTIGSGVSGAGVSGGSLIITLVDGTTLDAGAVIGPQGIGVSSGGLSGNNLIITLSNGRTFDVGNVKGPQGATGFQGSFGSQGPVGNQGTQGLGLPEGGLIGYSLVKKDNTDFSTEWKDTSLQIKGTPGNIGGWETKKIENIVGEGPLTSGRNRFPRWSPNLYISEVHKGPGLSLDGSTGFFMSAGFLGNSSGYDDGVSAGYKILNFFENTTRFEGNTYFYATTGDSAVTTAGATVCAGQKLDSPPGFYWNRQKYFPTTKLTPIYISNYSVVDQLVMYIAGYRDGATANTVANKNKRRGTFGFFGVAPVNSFPSGTPYSSHKDYNGFVQGSTSAYYFRPSSASGAGTVMSVAQSDANFDITGVSDGAYTGPYVKEVRPGRTGPIGLYSSQAGNDGISGGFTLEPGWYFIVSEFIPAAWFSVGTSVDVTAGTGAGPFNNGLNSDGVIITHTNAATHNGDIGLFGLNGFELAPEGESVKAGVLPEPFVPSCYMGVPAVQSRPDNIRSMQHPTGLPPHLWYNYGFSGATHYGRFLTGASGTSNSGGIILGPHIGLHSYDVSSSAGEITEEGSVTIRSQNSVQGSAPRIALSIISTSNALETLTTFEPGVKEVDPPSCLYDCFDWHQISVVNGGGGITDLYTENGVSGDTGGQTFGTQLGSGTPDSRSLQCPTWCCPGTTFANFQFDGRSSGGDYSDAKSDARPGAFIPYADFPPGTVVPNCGSTSGYSCKVGEDCDAAGQTFASVDQFTAVIDNTVDPPVARCCQGGGLAAATPETGNFENSQGGLTSGSPASRTISIYVNTGEDHHVKWFGENRGSTGYNHLIWHTSKYGCTSGTTFPVYEGPE
jgi:hypothetical protein